MTANRRLRVGVYSPKAAGATGHGKVWGNLIAGLRTQDAVEIWPRRMERRARPDVWLVDGHQAPPPVSEPIVSIVHDVRWTDPNLWSLDALAFATIIGPETGAAIRASARVLTPSEASRRAIVAAYSADDNRVLNVPYGVDPAVFHPDVKPTASSIDGLPKRPYVLFVGTVEPRKNVGVVREAMEALAQRDFPHALVMVLGAAPGRDSRALLRAASTDIPGAPERLVVLRHLSERELARVTAAAAVLCLPSLYEGFGLPVLEAMACGVPVVVSNRGALPELVADAGLIVEPSVPAVAKALGRVLSDGDLAVRLSEHGRRRAGMYPWTRTVEGCVTALDAAAHQKSSSPSRRPESRSLDPVRSIAACPVCRRPVRASAWTSMDHRIALRRCPGCGVHHADRVLDANHPAATLPTLAPEWPGTDVDPERFDHYLRAAANDRIRLLAGTIDEPVPIVSSGRDDEFLARARDTGWEVRTRADAVARYPSPVVATAIHLLQRSSDTTETLRQLGELAGPNGYVLVEVPNWASAARRRDAARWHYLRPFENLTHFDPASLRYAIRRAGLDPIMVRTCNWRVADLELLTHPLPPLRRALRALFAPRRGSTHGRTTSEAALGPFVTRLLGGVSAVYGRLGLGDVIIAVARVPGP